MGVQYFGVCSCVFVLVTLVWCKPLISQSQLLSVGKSSASSSSSQTDRDELTSLPVLDQVDSIFSRVVASNTQDNQLTYKTYSGIRPTSANKQHLYSPLSEKSMHHKLFHNPLNKPSSLTQNNAQLSDLKSAPIRGNFPHTEVQQKNLKNADVKSNAISSSSFHVMPNSDRSGQLVFTDSIKGPQASEGLYEETDRNMAAYHEFSMAEKNIPSVQLALKSSDITKTAARKSVSETIVTLATSLVALFSVAVVVGIFGCCCKKKQQSDVNDNANKDNTEVLVQNNTQPVPTVETELINASDIPTGEEDLDDFTSVKDKIKAFDTGKLVIQHSPDPTAKRKSQNDLLHDNHKIPNIVSPPEEDVVMRDKTEQSKSKSLGDGLSKSDTQDDVSDKIFDNISMESSSISQPHNPDVVIAESDEEGEFAELQRGTVILKSFQRAKPPRNRSPATRTSKGKIRKSRPGLANERGKSPNTQRSRDPSHDKETVSSPSSISVPPSLGVSSKTNSLDNHLNMSISLTDSLEKRERNGLTSVADSMEKSVDSLMLKSIDFNDFDSVMSKSVTSIGSDVHKKESPVSARHKRVKESPKGDRPGRTDSPARSGKGKDKDLIGESTVETRNESPNRYKKNKESPHGKRKHRKFDKGNGNHVKKEEGLPTDISEGLEVKDTSVANRLSGLPPNVNNIFYLIDPTVKNKCKSVGDMTDDNNKQSNRRSGDYSKQQKKVKQRDEPEPPPKSNEDPVSPVKRERTQSDPYRKSKLIDQTHM